ncbi:MAG: VOC family protein [Candidatus Moranbacteria bacterium]|nr:VOC family protein [Candidatus Moranbacteria bacterium]
MIKLDHTYVSVLDMDRAIKFYEELLEMKITHREEDTWADFDMGGGVYFGLINPKYVAKERIIGNNTMPVFSTDNVDEAYEKVKAMGVEIISPLETLDYTDYFYRVFNCKDTEGNLIEIAQYKRD